MAFHHRLLQKTAPRIRWPAIAQNDSVAEAKVAFDIAIGHHGLGGELINKKDPFTFCVIAKNQEELENFKSELQNLNLGEKVKIDGFVFEK